MTHETSKITKNNPMEAGSDHGVTNHDFAVAVTRFDDGHEIAMPKRMTRDEAARYAAVQGLF